METFLKDNGDYESWLEKECDIVKDDLGYKHERMTQNAFTFLRATCFRWSRRIEDVCGELKSAPQVLSVGDAHLENFGTWRDGEGRFVWGVNDYDEAANIPYAYDLLRLATSARLFKETKDYKGKRHPFLSLDDRQTAEALLKGYCAGLANPRATFLDETENAWLRPYVACPEEKRRSFWKEFDDYSDKAIPKEVRDGFESGMPKDAVIIKTAPRPKRGGGSLGRPRFAAVADWRGERIVWEAKALVPASWDWAHHSNGPNCFQKLAKGEYRSYDPGLTIIGDFVFRRLAADERKVSLTRDSDIDPPESQADDVRNLLGAMGFDIGSIHAAAKNQIEAITSDLRHRPDGWLCAAAAKAAEWVSGDYEEWCKRASK